MNHDIPGPTPGPTVVKVGGRPQADPALPAALAELWRATGGRLVIVHGGGDAVSELQRARGVEPRFVGGRRVTTPGDLDVLRMALSGLANKQLVAALRGAGVPAFGCSGEDGALLTATRTADAALGAVGVPARVDAALLDVLLRAGQCPVISPVSADAQVTDHQLADHQVADPGGPAAALNVNGDDAAAAVAAALGAAELFFLADVPGVLVGGAPVAALAALAAGVGRVRIGDIAALADSARGTTVVGTANAPARAA